jgi:hypothetical protein
MEKAHPLGRVMILGIAAAPAANRLRRQSINPLCSFCLIEA